MTPTTHHRTVADFFDEGLDNRLNMATEDGSALPNVAYTSDAFYQFEQETVFRKTWVLQSLPINFKGQEQSFQWRSPERHWF